MSGIDLFKNPLFIGIAVAGASYFYLKWENDNKHKKNPDLPKKKINYLVPIILGLVSWFLACGYFEAEPIQFVQAPNSQQNHQFVTPEVQLNQQEYRLANDDNALLSESFGSRSYHLAKPGVKIPNNLPDVFIETYT